MAQGGATGRKHTSGAYFASKAVTTRLAKNLRAFRHDRGWSQEELAFQSGMHRTYISDIERGARNPTIEVIDRLALTLKVMPGSPLDN